VETGRSNEKLPKTDAEKQEEIARLQKELRNEYSDAGRYVRMAELHAGLKQQDQSKECLHQAILFYRQRLKTSPSDTSLMRSLGRALVGTGSRLEGMSFLEEAADLLEAGGFLEAMMGNSEQAETDLRLCTSLDPGREKAWMLLAMAVAKISLATRQITPENRETMALVLVQGIAARDTPGLRKHYGRLLFSMDRLDESEQQFGMARKAAPDDLEASLDQAVALIRKEDSPARLPEAQAGLDRAEKILSELEAAGNAGPVESLNESERSQYQACRLIAQGVLDFLAESPEKAAGRFQSALKVDPKNEEAPRALELLKTAVRK
jgi:tetratricopeptide (TPR) repeat protein